MTNPNENYLADDEYVGAEKETNEPDDCCKIDNRNVLTKLEGLKVDRRAMRCPSDNYSNYWTETEIEKKFQVFLIEYLENVKRELPQSFRAIQLKNGGLDAKLVLEFETRFLKQPFMKQFLSDKAQHEKEINAEIKYRDVRVRYILNEASKIFQSEISNLKEKHEKEMGDIIEAGFKIHAQKLKLDKEISVYAQKLKLDKEISELKEKHEKEMNNIRKLVHEEADIRHVFLADENDLLKKEIKELHAEVEDLRDVLTKPDCEIVDENRRLKAENNAYWNKVFDDCCEENLKGISELKQENDKLKEQLKNENEETYKTFKALKSVGEKMDSLKSDIIQVNEGYKIWYHEAENLRSENKALKLEINELRGTLKQNIKKHLTAYEIDLVKENKALKQKIEELEKSCEWKQADKKRDENIKYLRNKGELTDDDIV